MALEKPLRHAVLMEAMSAARQRQDDVLEIEGIEAHRAYLANSILGPGPWQGFNIVLAGSWALYALIKSQKELIVIGGDITEEKF